MKPYKPIFLKHIKRNYPNHHLAIQSEVNTYFITVSKDITFIAWSGNPMDKRLDFCAYFLALIMTLDNRNVSYEDIRKICLDITIEYVQPTNRIQAYFKKLLPKLINSYIGRKVIEVFARKIRRNKSQDGFIAEVLTDLSETYGLGYGINILECGICKLFQKHNYDKYSSILCEVDEITTGLAGLQMIRTGTIANGATCCDFRYKIVG